MSSNVLGRRVAKIALSYNGATTGSKKHKDLVDTFNKLKPNGQVARYTDYWCAIAWTAWMIKAGMSHTDVPMGYNVPQLVEQAKNRGIWVESDSHVPRAGDGIIYDWNDSGKGDNKGSADHIGVVYKVSDHTIYVIEGNAGNKGTCKKREVPVNGRTIRGFICPKYNAVYIDYVARRLSYKKGTSKKKYSVKTGRACLHFRRSWKKRFPKRRMGSGCHQFVMLVMKVCGYKTMPLSWGSILKYLRERCTSIKSEHSVSQVRKGDIMVYKRVDKKGVAHYHIWIVVSVDGKIACAEANQGRYWSHIATTKKITTHYTQTWIFRPKEG